MTVEFLEADLPKVAAKLKKLFSPGDIVGLSGQLAAGKTTLVSELARAYGYTGRVSSPTFVIEHRYPLGGGQKVKELVHLDLYRLNEEDFGSLDWAEYRHARGSIVFVEWPVRLSPGLLQLTKTVTIEVLNEKKRRLTVQDNPAH